MTSGIKNSLKYKDLRTNKGKRAEFLMNCSVNPELVGNFLDSGLQHDVFEYGENVDYVIKIPKFDFFNTMYGILKPIQVEEDWRLINEYFPEYTIPTMIHEDYKTGNYVVIQERVKSFLNLTSKNFEEVREQFMDIYHKNRHLEKEHGFSLDLWGKSGIIRTVKSSIKGVKVFVEMTNVVIDNNDPYDLKLKIVDTNLFRINTRQFSLSRFFTDKLIYKFSDYFLKRAKFLN